MGTGAWLNICFRLTTVLTAAIMNTIFVVYSMKCMGCFSIKMV